MERTRKGQTMIGLLVVLVIIAVLTLIEFSSMGSSGSKGKTATGNAGAGSYSGVINKADDTVLYTEAQGLAQEAMALAVGDGASSLSTIDPGSQKPYIEDAVVDDPSLAGDPLSQSTGGWTLSDPSSGGAVCIMYSGAVIYGSCSNG